MPHFRYRPAPAQPAPAITSLDQVRALAADALGPVHFFVAPGFRLEVEHVPQETLPWEIFHGRLLDRTQTNRRQTFEAWNVYLATGADRPPEPLLALLLETAAGRLHIIRAIECHVWEAYDEGNNVILSRETRRWMRELVGTIPLTQFPNEAALRDEIVGILFHAVVGSSRLPLTSVESPLPQFSLGQLAYFYHFGNGPNTKAGPMRSYRDLIDQAPADELSPREQAKLLETVLHAVDQPELAEAADRLLARSAIRDEHLVGLFQRLFNEATLSPWTDLVDKALVLLDTLALKLDRGVEQIIDFQGKLMRQLVRHLTAYDLVTFHHQGANYPDALLLDAVLKRYLRRIESHPALFRDMAGDPGPTLQTKRLRRRALRQASMLRRRYEGHRVPDAPTSQGESTWVLPPPHIRVPPEQILNPNRRSKRLYDGDPLDRYLGGQAHEILRQSIADLRQPEELRELGMALFVDRPLDGGKGALEPDQTPLFSYLAFSRGIAQQRLQYLAHDLAFIPDREESQGLQTLLHQGLQVNGIPVAGVAPSPRRGSVSLADAQKAADDFVIPRLTAASATLFFTLYAFGPLRARFRLADLDGKAPCLVGRHRPKTGWPGLVIYDRHLRQRVELDFDPHPGYRSRGGVELPVSPLRVLRVWEETGSAGELQERDLGAEAVRLPSSM